ncbi:MAG: TraR/DksA C4-type zinc finger protein [Candidatus Paceibacterota bacterium]|jgi:RNA polymerase-binding transcription factor DksA
MEIDIKHFEQKLIDEKNLLENELKDLGIENPKDGDWEATPEKIDDNTDSNDLADKFEDYEERNATLHELEERLKDVDDALIKIKNGNYGTDEVSGEPIKIERLEANPSARTNI